MSSYDAAPVIQRAIQSLVAQPLGSMRFLPQSDEEVALSLIEALESAGFKIVKQDHALGE